MEGTDLAKRRRSVLVIEDEGDVAQLLKIHLRDAGYEVVVASTRSALEKMTGRTYDLLITDLTLPDWSGLLLCRMLRSRGNTTPIIILTAKGAERDRIEGLEAGADDYVTKPFSMPELLLRVRALFRRIEMWDSTPGARISAGPITIDVASRHVSVADKSVALTAKEFDLLAVLAGSPEKVFTREDLLKTVWGYQHSGYRHTVDTHMSRLRSKLNAAGGNCLIATVWGVGYRFIIANEGAAGTSADLKHL